MKKDYYENRQGLWQSYSDMMSALMLVFVLIMATVVFKNNNFIKENQKLISENTSYRKNNQELNEKLNEVSNLRKEINKGFTHERIYRTKSKIITIKTVDGVMLLESGILFASGQSALNSDAKQILRQCLSDYFAKVFSEENKSKISGVIIEGHTDRQPFKGSKSIDENYIKNMELSQQRALSVVSFCLLDPAFSKYRKNIRNHIFAEGKSFSEHNGPKDDWIESRTVKIKYRVKAEEKGR